MKQPEVIEPGIDVHPITAEMLCEATVLGYLYLVYREYNVPLSINNMFQACSPHYLLFNVHN